MAHPNEVLVRDSFAAFGGVTWTHCKSVLGRRHPLAHPRQGPPGRGPRRHGSGISVLGRLAELTGGTFIAELHDVLANDEQAVAMFTLRAERASKQFKDN